MAGRLVQDQGGRVRQEGPRHGCRLPFAGGEPYSALADRLVEVPAEPLPGADRPDRRLDPRGARVRVAEPQVVGQGAGEAEPLLGYETDGPAQVPRAQVPQVDAVEAQVSGERIVEPQQQPGDGGLAGTGDADECQGAPGRDAYARLLTG
ncbi:hypothetical protein Lfu02_04820 [Longispora fulva]|uniref:Uncharacterized protein n=1 Tax=Longispora fulva TaxID=619741 RepID=A0A8J7KJN8_9ACTN|nr:hypothetical protein [Longispora fulva]MBG6135651.1 hypothetical protein [Longispora fulva]GIG56110.1 hypothetical protein Lfu02_04820 [Longispora fulva]